MTSLLEDAQEIEIKKWGSLNTAASPHKLPEGQSPNMQNVWTDEKPGSLVTANGYTKLGQIPSGLPPTLLLNFFKASDGSQTVIVSDGQTVWKTTDYVNFESIADTLSPYFQLRGMVIRDKLWLTNGSDPVMTYDGTTLTVLDGTSSTPNVPKAKYIAYHDERVWLYGIDGEPSSLRFASLSDSSGTEIPPDDASAWPQDNEIQISEGDSDIGTGLFLFRGYIYASKSFSIWRIVGYDEYTYSKVKTRSSTGTRFAESVQILDNLVQLVGVDGLYEFDGEVSTRVSDSIDPFDADEGVFAFRNLQQPLVNNKFWNVTDTADWNTGTVPANLSTANNKLVPIPADDSVTDFQSGSTITNIDTTETPGSIQLAKSTGGRSQRIGIGLNAYFDDSGNAEPVTGDALSLTDGDNSEVCGISIRATSGGNVAVAMVIDLTESHSDVGVGGISIRGWRTDNTSAAIFVEVNTGAYQSRLGSNGTWALIDTIHVAGTVDLDYNFTTLSAKQVRIRISGTSGTYLCTQIEAYAPRFELSGTFVSKTLDYVETPHSFGSLAAQLDENGETYQFFTQSSADGSSWDSPVNVSNGGGIASTARRYLRWGVTLTSSLGRNSVLIDAVYVGAIYLSEIFNTQGNIFQWGAFQMSVNKNGQSLNAYYRAGTDAVAVAAASWVQIVPGALIGAAITDTFIQVRLYLSNFDPSLRPSIGSFTVNWVVGTNAGVNTLQNVASFVWLNRYWLSAATLGADQNDIVVVRGKSTYGSPWHKKDFSILSFARFQDYFIAGSSTDGSIYRMEYGYSKDGAAMDSYFETADFSKSGFLLKLLELVINLDRTGPYPLSVGISTDGGITYTEKSIDLTRATETTNLSFTKKIIIGSTMADKFRLRFRINAADQPFTIDDLSVYYRISPIRGSLN